MRMWPPSGRCARWARHVCSSKPGVERGARGGKRSVLRLGGLVSWLRGSGGPPQRLTSPVGAPGAAKDGGRWRPVREQEPADARGMPPAPLPPVTQFFIVGGLAVPAPLPADHKLGIRGLAPAERGVRDRASSLSARCRPRSRLEFLVSSPPTPGPGEGETPPSPAGSEPQGGPRGGPAGGRGCRCSAPGRGSVVPVPASVSWSLQRACHQLGPWGAAQGHSGGTTCGAGPGPWNPGRASVTRPVLECRFPGLPAPPRVPSSSARGAGLSLGRRRRGTRDSWAVMARRARGPRDLVSPFTRPRDSIHASGLHPGSCRPRRPPSPPSPPGERILAGLPLSTTVINKTSVTRTEKSFV